MQERNKRDRECKQPSQGNPHQVKPKRQQRPKRSKPKSGDTTASQKGLKQYGFGPIPVGGTQCGPSKEGQRPLRDVEEPNRETRSKLTMTVDLLPTPGRESGVEGQDSVEAPRATTSQDYLVTLGTRSAGQRWYNVAVSRTIRHQVNLIWISPGIRSLNCPEP